MKKNTAVIWICKHRTPTIKLVYEPYASKNHNEYQNQIGRKVISLMIFKILLNLFYDKEISFQ